LTRIGFEKFKIVREFKIRWLPSNLPTGRQGVAAQKMKSWKRPWQGLARPSNYVAEFDLNNDTYLK
jgi:hypothetical protein